MADTKIIRYCVLLLALAISACSGSSNAVTSNVKQDASAVDLQTSSVLSFVASSSTVARAAGTVQLSVSRTGDLSGTASVNFTTADGTGVAGTDYTAASGTLTWADADGADKTITVAIGAGSGAATSTFSVSLSDPASATVGSMATTTVTVTGGDTSAAGNLHFSASTFTAQQSSGSVKVSVSRAGGSTGAVSVNYATKNGTAVAGSDYTAESGTLSWADSDSADREISIPLSTAAFTGNKTFSVTLTAASAASVVGSPGSANVTVTGNSATSTVSAVQPGQIALAASSVSVSQSAASVQFNVSRSGGSTGSVSVNYATADGTAVAGTNYQSVSGILTWSNGDSANKSISVPIIEVGAYNGTKKFTVALSAPTGNASLSTPNSAAASITGTAAAPVAAGGITIDVSKKLSTISGNQLGLNLASAFDITQGNVLQALQTMGARMVRWPGGSNSDASHWKTMTYCDGAYQNPNSTFDNFMQGIVKSGSMQAAITVNYGSNQACTGGGDPTEAAAWVAYAKSKGYNSNVHYWTVGNEVYGGWEYDLHAQKNDPGTYAAAVAGSNGYYQLMKNADSTAQVGVVVEGMPGSWDNTVLTEAPYDFVELHWYAQQNGSESDSYLLTQAPADLRDQLATLREELSSAGKPNAPIMLGEFNSVNQNPGKQTMSVVNALFIGMTFGEVLNNGVAVATAWFGYDNSCHTTANNSSALYGWQNFGGYQLITENWQGCGNSPAHAGITTFPAGYAQGLVAQFAQPGGSMLSAAVGTGLPNIRAYASSNPSGGYSVMMFNLSSTATTTVAINLANAGSNSYTATTQTYGKAQYDTSKSNVWTGPVSQSLGTVNGAAGSVTLPPYSMTVLQLK
jgi:hypothetical protein